MTTIGFHYFPDDTHYRAVDVQAWLPELKALGAQSLTIIGSLTRAVPEPFLTALKQTGIEPIIHILATPIRAHNGDELKALFEMYARWGVKYVSVFAEPNARSSWTQADWAKTALVDRFIDIALPVWQAQLEAGLEPVFPALKAGGDYWDTAFLEAALAKRNQMELVQRLTFAVNLWTLGRPVEWGQGGLRAWPTARPYATTPAMQDQRGFHLFDWYNEIIEARLGGRRPLLCLAGGPRLGEVNADAFAAQTQEIVTLVSEKKLPDNLLNVNFWLLAAEPASPYANEAWYRADGSTLATVAALKQFTARNRPTGRPATGGKSTGVGPSKPLKHYLLLPTFEWGISEWHWNIALDYVKAHKPACGFSVGEAATAQRVTIFGNEQSVSAEVEAVLRKAGCEVERVMVAP
ncbi:MAG: hypothetical protein ACT4QE_06710 [Anaerolineales bacterium]